MGSYFPKRPWSDSDSLQACRLIRAALRLHVRGLIARPPEAGPRRFVHARVHVHVHARARAHVRALVDYCETGVFVIRWALRVSLVAARVAQNAAREMLGAGACVEAYAGHCCVSRVMA